MTLSAQRITLSLTLLALFSACSGTKPVGDVPVSREETRKEDFGKLFGAEFLVFGKPQNMKYGEVPGGGPMRVNIHLWKATLDTLSFMPLASADAVGGVIVTDWYSAATSSSERLKLTVYIQDRQLRADAIKVTVFKEVNKSGNWVAATSDTSTARQIEDIILSKARDLKIMQKAQS
ncbi:MAG: DUF3576 domain-containing protein [Alphaproteobacteria bacterium]|nr:DUF3576 domain-containing protein [Alphaproteobacteria bacterium]